MLKNAQTTNTRPIVVRPSDIKAKTRVVTARSITKYGRNWRNKEREKQLRKSRACLAKSCDGRQVVDK